MRDGEDVDKGRSGAGFEYLAYYTIAYRRREVLSLLNIPADRPSFSDFCDPDSVRPTARPAARSAAKQIWGSGVPTDRPDRPARGSEGRVGSAPDRPTLFEREEGDGRATCLY